MAGCVIIQKWKCETKSSSWRSSYKMGFLTNFSYYELAEYCLLLFCDEDKIWIKELCVGIGWMNEFILSLLKEGSKYNGLHFRVLIWSVVSELFDVSTFFVVHYLLGWNASSNLNVTGFMYLRVESSTKNVV